MTRGQRTGVLRKGLPYLVIVPVVFLDLVTKSWASGIYGGVSTLVPGFLSLRVVHNRGMLFSLGENTRGDTSFLWVWVVWGIALAALSLLAWVHRDKKPMRHLSFACMIGGALGNGLDRALHGYVTDFLHIRFLPIINCADLFFVGGMSLLIVDMLREKQPT